MNPTRMQQLQHRQGAWFGALLPLLLSCTHAPNPGQLGHTLLTAHTPSPPCLPACPPVHPTRTPLAFADGVPGCHSC